MGTTESVPELPPRIVRLRIRGFRSYGTETREIELDSPVTVVRGDNSQGKTATAEALEFLFTGCISRRDLFGGAKVEYERMLANVHLPLGDNDIWVEAAVRGPDGVTRTVRRTLTTDYSGSADCASTVLIDGQDADMDSLGIPFGEPPLAAPVLLQHNLRYVLSTEPQKRAAYFRALLELTDLDAVGEAVKRAKERMADLPTLPWVAMLSALHNSIQGNGTAASAISQAARASNQPMLTKHLIAAANALSPSVVSKDAEAVTADLRATKAKAEEKVFPMGALAPNLAEIPADVDPTRLGDAITTYGERLGAVDDEVARLTPIFDAVLKHSHLGTLTEPTRCPVCNDGTLSTVRIAELREQLAASGGMQEAARTVASELQLALQSVDRVGIGLNAVLPSAGDWGEPEWAETSAHREALNEGAEVDVPALNSEDSARGMIMRAGASRQRLRQIRAQLKDLIDAGSRSVAERAPVQDGVSPLLKQVNGCIAEVQKEAQALKALVDGLHEELGERLQSAALPSGTREILDLLEHREELHHEQCLEAQRKGAKRRIDAVGRMIDAAERALLDDRFEKMGSEIDRWWATLRPDELVRFGGVGRRASGRRYVNLTAELAVSSESSPQVRDAVGVFSDSQLNALGLAAFLARQRLLKSPVVVLDDPLPGYDPDHQVTFAAYTITRLLDEGVQVILLTHDPKVEGEVVGRHQYRGLLHYRLALHSAVEGTLVTNEDDFVGRKLIEARGHLQSQTLEGRKAATSALRDSAERLGKQIMAAARTANGNPTTVASLGKAMLGQLIPEILPHVQGPDEPGRWNSWKNTLNSGSHDDEVPAAQSLTVALGEINKVRKDHDKHWQGGLPR
ncbi:AAA family ATPase [Occultella aeris]|uniref:Recombination protein F n=1 Tax=Occultella aeris TaxID=2761496 RepID=A0A7M4DJV0_9MICO|nr:AAA family ATPase [Occultella aeris]VZO37335.1 recombination protein F [Occultella aeris]